MKCTRRNIHTIHINHFKTSLNARTSSKEFAELPFCNGVEFCLSNYESLAGIGWVSNWFKAVMCRHIKRCKVLWFWTKMEDNVIGLLLHQPNFESLMMRACPVESAKKQCESWVWPSHSCTYVDMHVTIRQPISERGAIKSVTLPKGWKLFFQSTWPLNFSSLKNSRTSATDATLFSQSACAELWLPKWVFQARPYFSRHKYLQENTYKRTLQFGSKQGRKTPPPWHNITQDGYKSSNSVNI